MNAHRKKTGQPLAVSIALCSVMVWSLAGWSGELVQGTEYKITLPGADPSFSWQGGEPEAAESHKTRSRMLFKLSPSAILDNQINSQEISEVLKWNRGLSVRRLDFIRPDEARMQSIHKGFSYSAAIDIGLSDAQSTQQSESDRYFISSRQLGIHFGRLGAVNYRGVDLSFRKYNNKPSMARTENDDKELWSLGVTTGRRFALTGLQTSDPIWTVSLRGQFNFIEKPNDDVAVDNQQWYLSPGLHWEHDSFRLSADVLMPFLQSGEYVEETDYRIRAKIQKRF